MAVVTITTDYGKTDFYLAALKGALLSACGNVPVVELNVNVRHFDIKQAAYSLQHAYHYFPKGTIHLALINPDSALKQLLICKFDEHYFVSFNNGLLPLFLKESRAEIFVVKSELASLENMSVYQAFSAVAKALNEQEPIHAIAELASDFKRMTLPNPTAGAAGIKGNVISIDGFGNAITNISKECFEKHFSGKNFEILINHISIKELRRDYGLDNDEGDTFAFFNDSGLLEVGVCKGNAHHLLGFAVNNTVMIVAL